MQKITNITEPVKINTVLPANPAASFIEWAQWIYHQAKYGRRSDPEKLVKPNKHN